MDTSWQSIEYHHNALGQRVAKLVNGQVTEKYLWRDLITLLATYDANGNVKQRFEHTLGHTPTSFTQDGQRYFIQSDHLGSPRMITDSSGSIVKTINYDSYGNVIEDANPGFEIPFGFAGGLYDKDTGLIRFGFRDYDPSTGRWTARDPIGFAGGDTNLYGYVLGDPVNWADPIGLAGVPASELDQLRSQVGEDLLRMHNETGVEYSCYICEYGPPGQEVYMPGPYTRGVSHDLGKIPMACRMGSPIEIHHSHPNDHIPSDTDVRAAKDTGLPIFSHSNNGYWGKYTPSPNGPDFPGVTISGKR